jgi:hypothetical protein
MVKGSELGAESIATLAANRGGARRPLDAFY